MVNEKTQFAKSVLLEYFLWHSKLESSYASIMQTLLLWQVTFTMVCFLIEQGYWIF